MLKVKASVLKDSLNQLSVIYKPVSVVPQDAYCLFESDNDKLKIRFSNAESEMIVWVNDVEIDGPFKSLIHYSKLRTSISLMSGDVKFSFSDSRVTLSDGSKTSRITLPDMQKMMYYGEKTLTDGQTIEVDGEEFITGLNAVKDCAANKSKALYSYLESCLFDLKSGYLTFAAMTAKMMATYKTSTIGTYDKDILVPMDVIHSISKWKDIEKVVIKFNENRITFQTPNLKLSTILLEGQFPNWRKLFEEQPPQWAEIHREDLLSALKFSTSVSSVDKTPVMDVHLVAEDGMLKVKTYSMYNDATETVVRAENFDGLKVAFTGPDIAKLADGCLGYVHLGYTPNVSSGRFFINSDDENYHAVIAGLQFRNA